MYPPAAHSHNPSRPERRDQHTEKFLSSVELEKLLEGCRMNKRESQEKLYRQFFALAMSVCIRYARTAEEAREMCNDGFERLFRQIGTLREAAAFRAWLRTLMVRASIDYHRKYFRHQAVAVEPLEMAAAVAVPATALDNLSADEKMALVQQLPASLRVVFNLYVAEGYNTSEIATLLNISEGTARAYLIRARTRLQEAVLRAETLKSN